MKNIDKLKTLNADELAQKLVFDVEGFERGVCPICARKDDCCDDRCYQGIKEWLELDN